jgi:hypothetical protein
MEDSGEAGKGPEFRPPYISWATLNGLFTKLAVGPIPPRIDKGYLDNYSGGTQSILLVTLRTLALIDTEGKVSPELVEIATDEDTRKVYLREQLDKLYPEQLGLAQENATGQQLEESFRKWRLQGSTLRKAIAFYLDLVKYTEAPNSPFFKVPKQSGTTASRRLSKGTNTDTDADTNGQSDPGGPPPRTTKGEQFVVDLGGAGQVTVNVEVKWLDLSDSLFTALRRVTNELRSLGKIAEAEADAALAAEQDDQEVD